MMQTATTIKKMRRKLLMEQEEFGQFLGVSKQSISLYERGLRSPRMGTLSKIRDLAVSRGIDFNEDDFFKDTYEH